MSIRPIDTVIAAALCGGGLLFAAVAIATIPLDIGGTGFGYKKLMLLLVGLESAGCGVLLMKRMRNAE